MPVMSRLIVSSVGMDWLLDFRLGAARFVRIETVRLVTGEWAQLQERDEIGQRRIDERMESAELAEPDPRIGLWHVVAHEVQGGVRYDPVDDGQWNAVPVIRGRDVEQVDVVEMQSDQRVWQMVSSRLAERLEERWPRRFSFGKVDVE